MKRLNDRLRKELDEAEETIEEMEGRIEKQSEEIKILKGGKRSCVANNEKMDSIVNIDSDLDDDEDDGDEEDDASQEDP